jgi:hypothetical protein
MQHLEVSGAVVLYIGRTVSKGLKVYEGKNLELLNFGEISPATQHRIPEDRKTLKECFENCLIVQKNCGSLGLPFIFLLAHFPSSSVLP